MSRRPPRPTRTDTLFPYTALFRSVRELLVGELGFLQADHVRLRVAQPLFQVRQAHVEGVDVPAGDFHRSEEHTSELQSLMRISYAVFCLKKKKHRQHDKTSTFTPLHNLQHKGPYTPPRNPHN